MLGPAGEPPCPPPPPLGGPLNTMLVSGSLFPTSQHRWQGPEQPLRITCTSLTVVCVSVNIPQWTVPL